MSQRSEDQKRMPITILTGFLGAGKTTLLNRILRGDHGLRVAVLVNDFGAINIDAELVVGVEGEAVSLANGCICCTIRDDLAQAVEQLLDRPDPPQYVLIEASGVSDPFSVALAFASPPLGDRVALDSIIAVVDAEQARQTAETNRQYRRMIHEQIAVADIVVLNKVDLVDESSLAETRRWVNGIVPRARILQATHGDVPLRLILDVGRYRIPLQLVSDEQHAHDHHHDHDHECDHDHDHHHHDHGSEFETWSYESSQPLSLRAVRQALRTLPASIFRAKGILLLADMPDSRAVAHVVGTRVTVAAGERWGDAPRRTRLVFIGEPGGVDRDELQRRFDACIGGGGVRQTLTQAWQWVRSG